MGEMVAFSMQSKPREFRARAALVLACLLAILGMVAGCGANRAEDISACFLYCKEIGHGCQYWTATRAGCSDEMAPAKRCSCFCDSPMPFPADGGAAK